MRSSVCMMLLRLEQSHMPESRPDSDRLAWSQVRNSAWNWRSSIFKHPFFSRASLYVISASCLVPSSNWQHRVKWPHVAEHMMAQYRVCSKNIKSLKKSTWNLKKHKISEKIQHKISYHKVRVSTLAGSKTWFLCPGMTLYACCSVLKRAARGS